MDFDEQKKEKIKIKIKIKRKRNKKKKKKNRCLRARRARCCSNFRQVGVGPQAHRIWRRLPPQRRPVVNMKQK